MSRYEEAIAMCEVCSPPQHQMDPLTRVGHVHCGWCGQVTPTGHVTNLHLINGRPFPVASHRCCPGDCELGTAVA